MAALLLLLVTMTGPWLIDTHPATEKTCLAPYYVWLGDGYCACLITYKVSWVAIRADPNPLRALWLLPMLPFLSTMFLILGRGQHYLWIFHLIAWGLTAVFALFFFFVVIDSSHLILILWGSGFGGMLAVAMLAGEILTVKLLPDR